MSTSEKTDKGCASSAKAHAILAIIYLIVFASLFAGAIYWELNCRTPDTGVNAKVDF